MMEFYKSNGDRIAMYMFIPLDRVNNCYIYKETGERVWIVKSVVNIYGIYDNEKQAKKCHEILRNDIYFSDKPIKLPRSKYKHLDWKHLKWAGVSNN